MGKLIIPVGIPGSGKSTYGKTLAHTTVLSSDEIRRELFGSADAQYSEEAVNAAVRNGYIVISEGMTAEEKEKVYRSCGNNLVYRTMNQRCKRALRKGKNVFYDATNISRRGRERTLARCERLPDGSIGDYDVDVDKFGAEHPSSYYSAGLLVIDKRARFMPDNASVRHNSICEAISDLTMCREH